MKKPNNIDEYIAGYPNEVKVKLEKIRKLIEKVAPLATQEISYGIPCFKLNGKGLIYFAAFKKHIGFYPLINEREIFKDELAGYNGGKATVQFPLAKPLPMALIIKIVKHKVKENIVREKSKNPSQKKLQSND